MIKKEEILRAYDLFLFQNFAGCSSLQRKLTYSFSKANAICNILIELGIIERFEDCFVDKRGMRKQSVINKNRERVIKLINER